MPFPSLVQVPAGRVLRACLLPNGGFEPLRQRLPGGRAQHQAEGFGVQTVVDEFLAGSEAGGFAVLARQVQQGHLVREHLAPVAYAVHARVARAAGVLGRLVVQQLAQAGAAVGGTLQGRHKAGGGVV
jgi:hypothetical protein